MDSNPTRASHSHSDSNTHDSFCPSLIESTPSEDNREIPIWLSIFFGNPVPANPRLDHARFPAQLSEHIFKPFENGSDSPSKDSFDLTGSSNVPGERQPFCKELSAFASLVSLSLSVEDQLLTCVEGKCIVCQENPVQSFVYRPLCATKHGYGELADFREMHRLMATIASHTAHITRQSEVNWSIGSFMSDRPYVCFLAVPICSEDSDCHQTAAQMSHSYISGIIDGTVRPYILNDDPKGNAGSNIESLRISPPSLGTHSDDQRVVDASSRTSSPKKLSLIADPAKDNLVSIGATVFIGTPNNSCDIRRPLGCMVISSLWPHSMLPDPSTSYHEKATNYQNIKLYYEKKILDTARFRRATCFDPIAAAKLVHIPIAFLRTDRKPLEESGLRRLVIELSQAVTRRWRYPEVRATLGTECGAQIYEFAVPVCGESACEGLARAYAEETLKRLLPHDLNAAELDTTVIDSYAFDKADSMSPTVSVLVNKIPQSCLMPFDEGDSALELPKVAIRSTEQVTDLKDDNSREVGQHWDDALPKENDYHLETWVYLSSERRDYQSGHTDEERQVLKATAAAYEPNLLFMPLLDMAFWELHEAVAQCRLNGDGPEEDIETGNSILDSANGERT